MKVIVEIGTNSTKSVVANSVDGKIVFEDERLYMGRLGEGLFETNCLSDVAIERNIDILREIVRVEERFALSQELHLLPSLQRENVRIIATQALRCASNHSVFTDKVKELFDIDIHILTPEEEATCAFYSQYPARNGLVLDIGGGSTELIMESEQVVSKSFPIGAVFLKELCESAVDDFSSIKEFIGYMFDLLKGYIDISDTHIGSRSLTGIGGTFVTLVSIKRGLAPCDLALVEGTELVFDEIKNMLDIIIQNNKNSEMKVIKGLPSERADIMPYGTVILLYIMRELNIAKAVVSCRGVRHGYCVSGLCPE